MRSSWMFGACLAVGLSQVQSARAEADEPASFTPAKPLEHVIAEFPSSEYLRYNVNSEGYLWLRYTVGVDGKTHDISKIYELGNTKFSQRVIEAIKKWTFEPATKNGKPVVQSKYFSQYFTLDNLSPANREMLDAYNDATALLNSGKLDEANAILTKALTELRLSMLERGMLALPAATIELRRKNYLEARRYALMVFPPGMADLPDPLALNMWQALISADLMLGELREAMGAYRALQRIPGFSMDNPYVKLNAKVRDQWEKAAQLVAEARIPAEGTEGFVYFHNMTFRAFNFASVVGSLDRYLLHCERGEAQAKITLTEQWHVPADAGGCTILVYGSPGTTFKFVETRDDK